MQIRTHAATLLKFSGWLIPASVAYIFLQRVDVLLLTRYSDHYQLGLYSSAIRIIGVVSIFTGNLMVIFLPKAAAAVRSRRALNNYLVQSLIAISGILLVILLAIVFAPQMLTLTMGENYLPAAGALRLLLVSYIFIAILSPTSALLYGLDQTVLIFIERCVEIIVAVVAALLLVPAHGMIGAASALVLAYFCGCVFILVCDFTLVKPQEQES
jgi:O-antigen/teichoic acid export membrane protein